MNLTLAKKLYGIVGVLASVVVLISIGAFFTISYITINADQLNKQQGEQRVDAVLIRVQTLLAVQNIKDHVLRGEDRYVPQFKAASEKALELIKSYEKRSDTPEEKKLIDEARKAYAEFIANFEEMLAAQRENSNLSIQELDAIVRGKSSKLTKITDQMAEVATRQFEVKSAELKKTSSKLAIIISVAALLVAGLCIVGSVIVMRKLLISLNSAIMATTKVAQGDLTVKVEASANDEVGRLLKSVEGMAEHLKNIVSEIKLTSDSVASGSNSLRTSSEQITMTMNTQSSHASQIATAAEEMSQTVIDIAKNSSEIAKCAEDTANIARHGAEVVTKSVNESMEIAKAVMTSVKVVSALGDKSKQIGEIIGVIDDIADQTNLLALNAAIEAARAGEQGRGFAVVADEVRRLAERTAKATSEIGHMIRSIQQEVGEAVVAMQQTNDRVGIGQKYSTETGSELQKIVHSVEGLQLMVQQIASATEEISSTSGAISGDILNIATGVLGISKDSEHIANSSSELAGLSENMCSLMARFKV